MLATIVRAWGSTPREVGAKMVVDRAGAIRGTIGGGCGEAEVWQESRELFEDGRPRQVHVDLTDDVAEDSGKVCGGRFDVYLERWQPRAEVNQALSGALQAGQDLALLTLLGPTDTPGWKEQGEAVQVFSQAPAGSRLAYAGGRLVGSLGAEADDLLAEQARQALQRGRSRVERVPLEGRSYDVFIEVLATPPRLVIAGAGHIARPLSTMASLCGYRVSVIDDRPEYARAEFFPQAEAVICQDFAEAFRELEVDDHTHVVLVTRGHKHDEECLRQLIGRPLAYVGMIGSRRRTRAVFADLETEGIPSDWLDRVYAPIGIDIGAQTPEEISVCILAELIKIRRGGKASSLTLRNRG